MLVVVCFSVVESIDTIKADYYFRLARNDFVNKDYSSMYNHYLDVLYYNDREIVYKWFFVNNALLSMSEIESKEALVYLSSLIDCKKSNKKFDEKYTEAIIYKILK